MRKIAFYLMLAGLFLSGQVMLGQAGTLNDDSLEKQMSDGPLMSFTKMVVDYGDIKQNSDPLRVVEFTNTGTAPLVIQNARGSCGCTVPSYPKEPIMPGETSKIEIRYDTKRLGRINKTVTITTNEGGQPHVLKVIGNISKEAVEEGVPTSKKGLPKSNN
jgi:hypothetical protein